MLTTWVCCRIGYNYVLFLTTNWDLCVLCQEETVELLKCPANSARGTEGAGYKTLAENLEAFDRISCLPGTLKLSRLDEGQGIEATFRLHKAKWHDSCRLQFNKTKLQRAEKKKMPDKHDPEPPRKFTCLSREHQHHLTETCFFCGKFAAGDALRNASTIDIDIHVRQCALKLQDKPLLAKLSAGDLIAQEAKYHPQSLLCTIKRGTKKHQNLMWTILTMVLHSLDLSPILRKCIWIVLLHQFKLTDLANLYCTRLEQLGTHMTGHIHSTKLKNRILSYFPDMNAHTQGHDVVLVCNKDVGAALRKACEHDTDND